MNNLRTESEFPELEPDDLAVDSLDEALFNAYDEGGESVLRAALALHSDIAREPLEDAAAALQKAGKPSIARIVLEIASERPSELDAIFARYSETDVYRLTQTNIWLHRRSQMTGEPIESLRARYFGNQR